MGRKPVQLLLYALAILAIGLTVAQIWRATGFASEIDALNRQVGAPADVAAVDLSALPPIVAAFAQRNGGTVGAAPVVAAEQHAEMRLAPDQPFFPLTATQRFGTQRPDFVWHANGTMIGFIPVEIVDAYAGGQGLLEARIAGSITVARASGTAIDRGEAMRFLAELPFNPDAILNAPSLVWTQLDESHVEVAMQVAAGRAAIVLSFDAQGDIIGIEADRPRMVGDVAVDTKWIGRFADYGPVGRYRLPRTGEVAWVLPEGEFVYWRGGMTDLAPLPAGS